MSEKTIEWIPIAQIRVVNPRARNKVKFQAIVSSIEAVGLKKPITVSRRAPDADGTQYDLVCGQGRIEAMTALGQTAIPAIVTEASREEQYLMSLVENIARRPPSNRDLVREVRSLIARNYKTGEIATKLGMDRTYVNSIVHLITHGEEPLIGAVESGRLPISVAMQIAAGTDHEIQKALADAYENGSLRGDKLTAAKRMIAMRVAKQRGSGQEDLTQRTLTGKALVREYQHQIREQKNLVKKANAVKDQVLILTTAVKQLLADEHFVTLLRAENLADLPEQLADRLT
ncbi:MAG TPA: plasmid partitioning protein RepB C-terminal domain-containing protein [Nitrospira sp.]|nr:plasmid partitioning protein RepB C-terminal domain-containing protein [Nitrospira sp.]